MAKSLIELGVEDALVVHGSGLDEVTIDGVTYVAQVKNKGIKE